MPCSSIISELEVLRAHKVESRNLVANLVGRSDCDEYRRYYVVDLKDISTESILKREISWEFLKDSRLIGKSEYGKVAKLGNIRIKNDKKAKGIGTDIHAQQYSVLKDNHFKQIQLSAEWDGVIAWPSLFFNFNNEDDEDELLEHIATYMFDVLRYNGDKIERIMRNYDGIKSISSYLRPKNDVIWFTEWYQDTDRSLKYNMYKDVS